MDSLASHSKWTSPRAAQWVPTVSTLSSPEISSLSDTTPRKRPRYVAQHQPYPVGENRVSAAARDTRSLSSVDVFDQLQAQTERNQRPLSGTDEVRALRAEAIKLEKTLTLLTTKWRTSVPSYGVLFSACTAALEKCATARSQKLNSQLKSELLMQQLYYAALQSGVTESPLLEYPNSRNIFDAIHTDVRLPSCDDTTRIAILNESLEASKRIAPAMAHRLTRNHVDRASLSMPYMGSSVTADEHFTYISTMFIAKIHLASVEQVFSGVMGYFQQLKSQVEHRFGIQYDTQTIHELSPSSEYGLVRYVKAGAFATVWNATLAATLTNECGAIMSDFIESDAMYPPERTSNRFRKEVSAIFTVSQEVDEATGVDCVVLRQVRVARYNLLPNSTLLLDEIQVDKSFSNGDLLMAIVCRHLRELSTPKAFAE